MFKKVLTDVVFIQRILFYDLGTYGFLELGFLGFFFQIT